MKKLFPILFILTGIFAILGALYTWGDGNIFAQHELVKVLIPWADIVFTGPLSILAGIGLLHEKKWGKLLGLVASGTYLFGSILVLITMIWNRDLNILLIIPSFSGFLIGALYLVQELKTTNRLRE